MSIFPEVEESSRSFFLDLGLDPEKMPAKIEPGVGKILNFESLLREDTTMNRYDITKPLTRKQLSNMINMNGWIIRALRSINKEFGIQNIYANEYAMVGTGDTARLYLKLIVKANGFTDHDALNAVMQQFPRLELDNGIWNCGFEITPHHGDGLFDLSYIDVTKYVNYSECSQDIETVKAPQHDLSVYPIEIQLLCLYELLDDYIGFKGSGNLPQTCMDCYKKLEYFKYRFGADGVEGAARTLTELLSVWKDLVDAAHLVGASLNFENKLF